MRFSLAAVESLLGFREYSSMTPCLPGGLQKNAWIQNICIGTWLFGRWHCGASGEGPASALCVFGAVEGLEAPPSTGITIEDGESVIACLLHIQTGRRGLRNVTALKRQLMSTS